MRPYRLGPTISQLLSNRETNVPVSVTGWLRSIRRQKRIAFAVLSDGSETQGLQAVFADPSLTENLSNGASVSLTGKLAPSLGSGQAKELQIESIQLLGPCDPVDYPIQKKTLSVEHLREHVHLRTRTNAVAAMLRVRNALVRNIHRYFEDEQGFTNVHTPILTGNDAEGAGETFRIAPISQIHPSSSPSSPPPPPTDFFTRPAYLTVSSQLHLEALASSLSRVYTLSPCFRAEPSQTNRHLSEFWMLEAEWVDTAASSPSGVQNICSFVEDGLRTMISPILHTPDIEELWSSLAHQTTATTTVSDGEEQRSRRRSSLENAIVTQNPWARISYTEAIKELQTAAQTTPFDYAPRWGSALQSEHERWLAESLFKGPVFITDYPRILKPFYMRTNNPDKTVACFDLIAPYVGELVGGSVREERLAILEANIKEAGMSAEDYAWYLDLRRFGGVPHQGFGLGFERLVAWITGIENIRECIAMPRWIGRMAL